MNRRMPAAVGCFLLPMLLAHCGPGEVDSAGWTGTEAADPYDASEAAPLGMAGPCWIDAVTVRDFGRVVYVGSMDLTHEVWRIVHGEHLPYRHDGTVFSNREHRLPNRPKAYYREFVHPTPGLRGPGPQRLVRGAAGELSYTPDHYATFTPLNPACTATLPEVAL